MNLVDPVSSSGAGTSPDSARMPLGKAPGASRNDSAAIFQYVHVLSPDLRISRGVFDKRPNFYGGEMPVGGVKCL